MSIVTNPTCTAIIKTRSKGIRKIRCQQGSSLGVAVGSTTAGGRSPRPTGNRYGDGQVKEGMGLIDEEGREENNREEKRREERSIEKDVG